MINDKAINYGTAGGIKYMVGIGISDFMQMEPDQFDCLIVAFMANSLPTENVGSELNREPLMAAREAAIGILSRALMTDFRAWNPPMFHRLLSAMMNAYIDKVCPF